MKEGRSRRRVKEGEEEGKGRSQRRVEGGG